MSIERCAASSVVADQGTSLVSASPLGPVQPVADAAAVAGDQLCEEVADFVDCQGNQLSGGRGTVGSFAHGDDGEDGVGEHGQRGVAVPGGPLADLVLVETDLVLAGTKTFLDAPAGAGYPHQGGQADRLG